jgi:hypothetical protein
MSRRLEGFSGYMPGVVLIILGVLVILFPMLLVAFFSAILIMIGLSAILVVHRLKKWQGAPEWKMDWQTGDGPWGERLQRLFIYKRF